MIDMKTRLRRFAGATVIAVALLVLWVTCAEAQEAHCPAQVVGNQMDGASSTWRVYANDSLISWHTRMDQAIERSIAEESLAPSQDVYFEARFRVECDADWTVPSGATDTVVQVDTVSATDTIVQVDTVVVDSVVTVTDTVIASDTLRSPYPMQISEQSSNEDSVIFEYMWAQLSDAPRYVVSMGFNETSWTREDTVRSPPFAIKLPRQSTDVTLWACVRGLLNGVQGRQSCNNAQLTSSDTAAVAFGADSVWIRTVPEGEILPDTIPTDTTIAITAVRYFNEVPYVCGDPRVTQGWFELSQVQGMTAAVDTPFVEDARVDCGVEWTVSDTTILKLSPDTLRIPIAGLSDSLDIVTK